MGNLWTRAISKFRGLFAKKALEEPAQPVIPEVDFTPAEAPPPPVVMLEGVVPMLPAEVRHVEGPPETIPAPLIDMSWADIGEVADQAFPTDPLELRDWPEAPVVPTVPVEQEPPAPVAPVAQEPDHEPVRPPEPVEPEAPPAPIMALVEPVPEPAVPDQSEGWLARLWDTVEPEVGEGLKAPPQIQGLLVDPFLDQPEPNWVGGGQLGFLHARVSMGGI